MRKLITVLAVSSATAFVCVPAAHADVVVGGPRLAAHGYVWDHTAGVAAPPHIQASSYVIADLETGRILAAKDPHGHYRPASTLKTLTSITLIPRLDPAKTVRPSAAAVDASGSAVGLDTHWTYTVRDLFYGLLMQSGNDAAIALCEANGGLQPTLDEMNAEARRIRALDTVARTPNGLDDDPPLTLAQQHSSAYDLALIMKQGLKLPDFRTYVARTLYDWPAPPSKKQRKKGEKSGGWEIGTHDHLLLGDRYPGMVGGKNGWTSHALGSFVGAATRNGHTIIIALMHAQSDFWGDARSLLDWGFAERAKVAGVGTLVDPVPPPRPVQNKAAAAGRHGGVHAGPGHGTFTWWRPVAAGVGGAVLLGAVAFLIIGLRRRGRPAAAGPPPPSPASSQPASQPGAPPSASQAARPPDSSPSASPPPDPSAPASPPPAFGSAVTPGGGHVRPIPPAPATPAPAPGTRPEPGSGTPVDHAVPAEPEPAAASGEPAQDSTGTPEGNGHDPADRPDRHDPADGHEPADGHGNGSGGPRSARRNGDEAVPGAPPSGDGPVSAQKTPNPLQPAAGDAAATDGTPTAAGTAQDDPREPAGDAGEEDGEPAR